MMLMRLAAVQMEKRFVAVEFELLWPGHALVEWGDVALIQV